MRQNAATKKWIAHGRASSGTRSDAYRSRASAQGTHDQPSSRDADDSAGFVGVVGPFARVEHYQTVAKGVLHNSETADRYVYGLNEDPPTMGAKDMGGGLGRGNLPVWFVALPSAKHDLGLRPGCPKAGLAYRFVAPNEVVAKHTTIESHAGVKVGDRDRVHVLEES